MEGPSGVINSTALLGVIFTNPLKLSANQRLADASEILAKQPTALTLRYLQTLIEISSGNNATTTIFPIPIDILKPFLNADADFKKTQ